jgi:hypothetical protein
MRPHADARLRGDARGRDGGIREVMATRVKRLKWELEGPSMSTTVLAYVNPVHGLHNVPRWRIWRFDAVVRRGGQNGARPVQILRDDGRADQAALA